MWLISKVPRKYRVAAKAKLQQARLAYVRRFRSYDSVALGASLRSLGVGAGDTVLLHSAFEPVYGYRGTITSFTDTFLDVIGPRGNLLMMSLPYHSSALSYLQTLEVFDVRRTPSMMGLVSEFFRRRPDVVRSVHPTHPVLARGPLADWIVEGHELCRFPCGPGSPFEKMVDLDCKVIFFNVPFVYFTFFHNLEHLVSGDLPFDLYTDTAFEVPVVDASGERKVVTTQVFAQDAIDRRRFPVFESEMRRRSMIVEQRIGNGYLLLVRVRDSIECVEDMRRSGLYFYDFHGLGGSAGAIGHSEPTAAE